MAEIENKKTEEPKSPPESGGDENPEKSEDSSSDSGGGVFSAEGILMLCIAGLFDGIGLIPVVGDVSDIIAGIFFAAWIIITGKKGWWKFILALILEAIPIVSDIVPFISIIGMFFNIKLPTSWIGCVYSILSGRGGMAKKIIPIKANE
jgi:hypothetical protein